MRIYTTSEGDTVDYIVWRVYGATTQQVIDTVLNANHGLADMGPVLPAGTRVVMPEIESAAVKSGTHLWD